MSNKLPGVCLPITYLPPNRPSPTCCLCPQDMGKHESVNYDPAACSNGKYLPVESAMPGTTLGLIPLQAFEAGGTLYGVCSSGGGLIRLQALKQGARHMVCSCGVPWSDIIP